MEWNRNRDVSLVYWESSFFGEPVCSVIEAEEVAGKFYQTARFLAQITDISTILAMTTFYPLA